MSDNEEGEGSKSFMPLARVRRIMKSDNDIRLISQDAVVVVARATVGITFIDDVDVMAFLLLDCLQLLLGAICRATDW
jgi:hypothetical protein